MSQGTLAAIDYPESDGKPMGETDVHRLWMIRLYELLKQRYRSQRVYVGSDLLVYYTEGVPAEFVVPDDFVVLDSDPGVRRTFKIWEERRVPNVVFEVTSLKTKKQDQHRKPEIYAKIGVRELFSNDPTGDYLKPRLQGLRLVRGKLAPISPAAGGELECRELGLLVRLEKGELVLLDAESNARLLTEAETERPARTQADAERIEAIARAAAAEERARQLSAELRRRRHRGDS